MKITPEVNNFRNHFSRTIAISHQYLTNTTPNANTASKVKFAEFKRVFEKVAIIAGIDGAAYFFQTKDLIGHEISRCKIIGGIIIYLHNRTGNNNSAYGLFSHQMQLILKEHFDLIPQILRYLFDLSFQNQLPLEKVIAAFIEEPLKGLSHIA